MKHLFLALALLLTTSILSAQSFMPALSGSGIVNSKGAIVVKNDGAKVEGKVTSAMLVNGHLKSIKIKTASGEKINFKAADVKTVSIIPRKLYTFEEVASVKSIKELEGVNFADVINQKYIYFEQARLPGKKDRYALMQLLNPGFDSLVKVYKDPNSKQSMSLGFGGIKITGGLDKSYLVTVNNSNKSMLISKGKYKKEAFTVLYTKKMDAMKKYYGGSKLKWNDFAKHVFVYDQLK